MVLKGKNEYVQNVYARFILNRFAFLMPISVYILMRVAALIAHQYYETISFNICRRTENCVYETIKQAMDREDKVKRSDENKQRNKNNNNETTPQGS